MFFGGTVQDTRKLFYESWKKFRLQQPLLPLEQQLVEVIKVHPEYHSLLDNHEISNEQYVPEMGQSNPFLHMGLHLAIRDQISTDRPPGITTLYQSLIQKYDDFMIVEHKMMECLAELLWEAQRDNRQPDEQAYLERLKRSANC